MQLKKGQFEQFLGRLAEERGMVGKVRLLASAWPLLQQLSSSERDQVALTLGSSWARKHLDRLVTSTDLSPQELKLQQLLGRLENADPKELRLMARKLRRGEVRDLGGRFAAGLIETLEGEAESAERKASKEALAAQRPETPSALPPPVAPPSEVPDFDEVLSKKGPAAGAPDPTETTAVRKADPATGTSEEQNSGLQGSSLELTAGGAEKPLLETPKKYPEGPELLVDPVVEPAPQSFENRSGPDTEPNQSLNCLTSGAAPRTAPATTIQALRLLRSLQPESDSAPSTPRARAELIGTLGRGWAARRGILAMIRSGAFEQIEEALELIATLENPAAEFWCLAELLETSDLTETDIQRLLAACPGTAGRRRLERRVRRRALSA